jgi:hypothetical protein
MAARLWSCVLFMALAHPASACSVSVPWVSYVNLVELNGPRVEGLQWLRVYNIIDYTGNQRVVVQAVRDGKRIPVAKWQGGQECSYDAQGIEQCHENDPHRGIRLEALFGDWHAASEHREHLRRIYLPLIIQVDGRELRFSLSGRPVRNTRKLQRIRSMRITVDICERMDSL